MPNPIPNPLPRESLATRSPARFGVLVLEFSIGRCDGLGGVLLLEFYHFFFLGRTNHPLEGTSNPPNLSARSSRIPVPKGGHESQH